jgi:hypothetical protein
MWNDSSCGLLAVNYHMGSVLEGTIWDGRGRCYHCGLAVKEASPHSWLTGQSFVNKMIGLKVNTEKTMRTTDWKTKLKSKRTHTHTHTHTQILWNCGKINIFGAPKIKVAKGVWAKGAEEKLTKYYSGDQIKKNEMSESCSTHVEMRRVLMGKPEGRRPLGRPWHRWVDNIKMDFQEVDWQGGGGIRLDLSGWG